MRIHTGLASLMLSLATILSHAAAPTSQPLRVDINSEGRRDMRTVGWNNWRPTDGSMRQSFGDITVSLRASGAGGEVGLKGSKAIVIDGVTLGADAAVATGESPVMEVQIEGLGTGIHSFVGYHHSISGDDETPYAVSVGDQMIRGIKPTKNVHHNDEVASSYVEFEAKKDQPVVIRIAARDGKRVLLSGFAIDVANPRKKALKPIPVDHERHADGDDGKILLKWTPSNSAVSHNVYLVSDLDADTAARKLAAATRATDGCLANVESDSYSAPIERNNSLLHYAWRVDSVDASGKRHTWRCLALSCTPSRVSDCRRIRTVRHRRTRRTRIARHQSQRLWPWFSPSGGRIDGATHGRL